MNKGLKEGLSIAVCVGLLTGIGFYTGFLNSNSMNALTKVFNDASKDMTNINKGDIFGGNNFANNGTSYGKYKPNKIPADVIEGYKLSGSWSNLFASDKKVIFYVYDTSGSNIAYTSDFHSKFSGSYNKNNLLGKYYNLEPIEYSFFKNYYVGITGPSKICNSIEECNETRKKSTTKASMQMFLDRCGKYFCIINPKKNEYVMLKEKNVQEAMSALNSLKNW